MSHEMMVASMAKDKELAAAKQRIADLEAQIDLYARLLPSWKPMASAPIDRRILLLHHGHAGTQRVDIGRYQDQRNHVAPKPFWQYEGAFSRISYCRDFPPIGWMDIPQ
jgi:hypothetical protein